MFFGRAKVGGELAPALAHHFEFGAGGRGREGNDEAERRDGQATFSSQVVDVTNVTPFGRPLHEDERTTAQQSSGVKARRP